MVGLPFFIIAEITQKSIKIDLLIIVAKKVFVERLFWVNSGIKLIKMVIFGGILFVHRISLYPFHMVYK